MKVNQIPCFVLHRRPFRETSLILDVVTQDYGRLSVVLRGALGTKKTALSGLAQMFRPLLLSFIGKGELKTVTAIEDNGNAVQLLGKHLYSGFYINELICRLWPQNIDSQEIYPCYLQALANLSDCQQLAAPDNQVLEVILRRFEFNLLELAGYGIDCFYTYDNNQEIMATAYYFFIPEQGFGEVHPDFSRCGEQAVFSGEDILAIGEMSFNNHNVVKRAKQLMRLALAPHLGNKPLKSRELFIQLAN